MCTTIYRINSLTEGSPRQKYKNEESIICDLPLSEKDTYSVSTWKGVKVYLQEAELTDRWSTSGNGGAFIRRREAKVSQVLYFVEKTNLLIFRIYAPTQSHLCGPCHINFDEKEEDERRPRLLWLIKMFRKWANPVETINCGHLIIPTSKLYTYLRPVVRLECLANLHARAGQLLMMIFNLQESTKC